MRSANTFILSSLTVVMSMWPLHAQAQQPATVDARAEVATALYAASATQAAVERQANAKLRAAQAEIARLRGMGLEARSALIAAQERYVAELASRDRAYAEEIAVFRAALEEITSTRDGAAALARFNAGDEIGALDQLDEIVNARDTARRVRGDIETAAERRRVAALARDARSRGQIDTDAVIRRYVEITQLDPNVSDDWKQLSILHVDVGNLQEATRAAVRARGTARSNDEIRVALWVLGYAQIKQGNFAAVQSAAEEALRVISGSRLDATRPDYSKLTLVEKQNLASDVIPLFRMRLELE